MPMSSAWSDRVPPLQTIIFSSFLGRTKGCRPLARKMPGQNGASPAVVLCLNFNASVFLLLTERSECMLYSVTEDIKAYEQTFRSRAGHAGHAAAEDSRAGADERLRGQSAAEASIGRYSPGERRFALPGSAQAGTSGLDYC